MESYGPGPVRALTRASRAFFESPPAGFVAQPLLTPRGSLTVASLEQARQLEHHWDELKSSGTATERLGPDATVGMMPVMRRDCIAGSIYEPDASDIDVHALHQGYLRELRRAGGTLHCSAEVIRIERIGQDWQVHTGDAVYCAPIVLNAGGAWADAVARLAGVTPLGIMPMRRSAFIFAPPGGVDVTGWPAVMSAAEDWYFKPEAGMLLGSPANVDPVEPHDVQAEEMDIALAIDRIESMTTLGIRRPERVWAGLRSFVPDGSLVGGFDARVSGFFWVAAQGGYGIQTSAAMGAACAALALGRPIPQDLADFGITARSLSPERTMVTVPRDTLGH